MKDTGIIFDIERCSIYDGPGIRTTVFLKGCPLRCKWCHNPESQSFKPEIVFYEYKCVGCKACIVACTHNCHSIDEKAHTYRRENCISCGACVNVCSYGALEYKGYESSVQDILAEVEKDRPYYENSGGGITITGGEPMAQFQFTSALLIESKKRGINTCIETCGYAPTENYGSILPYVNIFLFDYKSSDPQKHKELVGVSNELILENLDYLYKSNAAIIVRCPLIPGVNDSEDHIEAIANLLKKYPNLMGLEIMPYHNMGIAKSKRIGKDAFYEELKTTSEGKKLEWAERFKELGCGDKIKIN
ncbi:MAG TPA: glycyl-radical enzyme activating protein [Clostridiaceae bacterium]